MGDNTEITNNEILGKAERRLVTPRRVPFGYQVEHWEKHVAAYKKAVEQNPAVDLETFMLGWNAAFTEIYGG